MKWKAQTHSEAGEVLKLLARQGEPLLKKLDEGTAGNLLEKKASNDEHHDEDPAESCHPSAAVAS
jgi:hypothetical protein